MSNKELRSATISTQIGSKEYYVPLKDGRVYYKKIGRGDPVIFLHGGGEGGASFDNVVPEIARDFTCYVLDLPGCDNSDMPARKYSIDDFTEAVANVMDFAELSKAHFIGNHTGATVSINMAAKHPERVVKLVIEDSPGWNLEEGKIILQRWFWPQYAEDGLPRVSPYEEAVKRHPNLDKATYEKKNTIQFRRWIKGFHEANTSFDVHSAMRKIQAPTLVIFQEMDPLRRREQRFVEEIKGAILRVTPGPGTTAHRSAALEFVSLVKTFLRT